MYFILFFPVFLLFYVYFYFGIWYSQFRLRFKNQALSPTTYFLRQHKKYREDMIKFNHNLSISNLAILNKFCSAFRTSYTNLTFSFWNTYFLFTLGTCVNVKFFSLLLYVSCFPQKSPHFIF